MKEFRQVSEQIGLIPNGQGTDTKKTDVQKTVTMASIIEKETAVADERTEVASVYAIVWATFLCRPIPA